jgi:flagellum-specific ATP synthase
MHKVFQSIASSVATIPEFIIKGKVIAIRGLLVEAVGLANVASIGSHCDIQVKDGQLVAAEVIGMQDNKVLLMPFADIAGIGNGCAVFLRTVQDFVRPHPSWLGRVIDAFGNPIDNKGPLTPGSDAYYLKNSPPPAHERRRVGERLDTGIRALNAFINLCRGQRMGIFAGSGVGKSMMMAMLTKYACTDIKIIGLIGERGREVQEFIEDYLGPEGLKNAIVVVATSDESALTRKQAAYMTMTLSEYFRNQNKEVLCMMDSVTRFAMAQREIGLTAGEPPTTKGYTPSVFSELPKLLERAGPGTKEQGNITALFSVLVEGDDQNEPIADAVRGIIDGHIVLERRIAERGVYPAINVLKSISRMMPKCNSPAELEVITAAKTLLSAYDENEDMIKLGAYKPGSNALVDKAIVCQQPLQQFLSQRPDERDNINDVYAKLQQVISVKNQE